MKALPTCCEYHHKTDCNQGRNCPARKPTCAITAFYAECEGVMPMVTGCSVKALPDPSRQPLPKINMPLDPAESALLWLVSVGIAGISFYIVVCFLQFIGG